MVARSPLLRPIQRSYLHRFHHAFGCEYEIELAGRRRRGRAYVVEGGDIEAIFG